jgi:hypothetical protein
MPYFAKLVKGQTYSVFNHIFLVDQEKQVDKYTYDYLNGNDQFEVWEGEAKAPDNGLIKPDGEKYTEAELKKLNKAQQEQIIQSLSKDFVQETKNEQERIALILKLQEENGE